MKNSGFIMCRRCGGSKKIKFNLNEGWHTEVCPRCNGEGIEIIITPEQWEEYQKLRIKSIKLNTSVDRIGGGIPKSPLDAISENKGKISLKQNE